jgi:hypothetical protein
MFSEGGIKNIIVYHQYHSFGETFFRQLGRLHCSQIAIEANCTTAMKCRLLQSRPVD